MRPQGIVARVLSADAIVGAIILEKAVSMIGKLGMLAFLCSSFSAAQVTLLTPSAEENSKIQFTVPPGPTLRLYLTKRVSKRQGAPVEGKLLEPVFAFDR